MGWISKIPALAPYKIYAYGAVAVIIIAAYAWSTVAAYRWGKEMGSNTIQLQWDAETKTRLQGNVNALDRNLTQSRADASAAAEQARKDVAAALAASEERQADRIENALRQSKVESLTRKPGSAYVDPRCVLDSETYKTLNEGLK